MDETRAQLADLIRRDVAATWRGSGSAVDELIADRRAAAAAEEEELHQPAAERTGDPA